MPAQGLRRVYGIVVGGLRPLSQRSEFLGFMRLTATRHDGKRHQISARNEWVRGSGLLPGCSGADSGMVGGQPHSVACFQYSRRCLQPICNPDMEERPGTFGTRVASASTEALQIRPMKGN